MMLFKCKGVFLVKQEGKHPFFSCNTFAIYLATFYEVVATNFYLF